MKIFNNLRKMANLDLHSLRMKYKEREDLLLESSFKKLEPISIFTEWLQLAVKESEILEPNAAALATVDQHGRPSNRFVLLKDVSEEGFTFFTNYGSRKSEDIKINPYVAMTFYWHPLRRSVRIEGKAEKLPEDYSTKYFRERPRESQIAAFVSVQSQPVLSREQLDKRYDDIKENLGHDEPVPMPNWGGYLIRPNLIEFWQGQSNRLHDRIRFRKDDGIKKEVDGQLCHSGDNGWIYERLAP